MARRHIFRFEPVLRLRQRREDEQKRVVAGRLRKIRQIEDHQRALRTRIAQQTEWTRRSLRGESVDIDALKWGRHWMIRLRRGVLDAEGEIGVHRALLAQEQAKLAQAAKEKRVLSRLKERRLALYLAEQERREQLELDEMNGVRFARSVISGDEAS
ncbi:MAG: flagellar export protein FliJ [Phycisphaerae bacterium]